MTEKWLVIGISGVTCGGKTTLAAGLDKILPNSKVISQDDYFLEADDPRHTWIPELNHINFELLTSLDMAQMHADILEILKYRKSTRKKSSCTKRRSFSETIDDVQKMVHDAVIQSKTNVLIIEGFSVFNYKPIEEVCDLKYYLTLRQKECKERRLKRVYEPPDCPGYFEKCVWPEYLKLVKEVRQTVKNVKYFDEDHKEPLKEVLVDIMEVL